MSSISFVIPGPPAPKGRARAFSHNGKIRHYTPEKTARYENLVKLSARQAMNGAPPSEVAVSVSVIAYMPIPVSRSRLKREQAQAGTVLPVSRPDLDNIVKAIMDGANGVTWKDDSQVVSLSARKRYGEVPRVEVIVQEGMWP